MIDAALAEPAIVGGPTSPRRSWGQMSGYAAAQIGGSIFLHLPAMLLMPFMTNALAVPAAFAGIVIFVPKVWVVFCDPLMGALSDRMRSRGTGRAKLVIWGGIAMAILLPLLFAPILLPTPLARGCFVLVAYVAGSTAFSAFSVPYLILASEVAVDSRDRTRLLALRQTANYLGALIVNYAPALVQILGGGRDAFGRMGLLFGVVCLLTTLSLLSIRKLSIAAPVPDTGIRQISGFGAVFRHVRFRLLLGAYALQMAAVGVVSASFLYFVVYRLGGDLLLVSAIATCLTLSGIAAQPLWVAIEARLGGWRSYIIAVAGMAAGDFSFVLLGSGARAPAFAIAVVVGVFSSGFAVMAWTLLLGIMSDARASDSGPKEGAFAGIWSASEKIAMAAGALLGGFALQYTGFKSSTAGFTPQTADAVFGIRLVAGGMTSSLLLLSLLFLLALRRAGGDHAPIAADAAQ